MLHIQDHSGITVLRLDHGKAHALDIDLCRALRQALAERVRDDSVRALVLTGTGSIFCAGVDLFRLIDGGADYIDEFVPLLVATFHELFAFPRPVVAAINGHAIAGGCVLAAASDYRIMADGSGTIGVPELRVGVPFLWWPSRSFASPRRPRIFRSWCTAGRPTRQPRRTAADW